MNENILEADNWFIKNGIKPKYLKIIKNIYIKEGILYNIKSFNESDIPELKKFLKRYKFYKLYKFK